GSAVADVTIDSVAGAGEKGDFRDGGPALKGPLKQPFPRDPGGQGGVFIARGLKHCLPQVGLKRGGITPVAGGGTEGHRGDGGAATKATLNEPYAVAVARNGDFYIVDRLNRCVRKVDGKSGVITTVAGTGKAGYSGDGGPGARALLREPNDCCLDRKGGLL